MASSAPSAPSAPPGTATATPAATTKDDPELDAEEVKFDDAAIEHRNAEEVDVETVAAEMAEAGFEDGDDVEEELRLEELEAAKHIRQNMKANSISFDAMLGIEELDAEDVKFDDAAIEHRNAEELDAAKAPLLVDDRTRAAGGVHGVGGVGGMEPPQMQQPMYPPPNLPPPSMPPPAYPPAGHQAPTWALGTSQPELPAWIQIKKHHHEAGHGAAPETVRVQHPTKPKTAGAAKTAQGGLPTTSVV